MVNLIALANFSYDGKPLENGDHFQATERHAYILKLTKKAEDAGRTIHTANLTSEDSTEEISKITGRPKRKYRRRDLVPEA